MIVISLTNTTGSDVDNVAVADSLPRLCRDGVGETWESMVPDLLLLLDTMSDCEGDVAIINDESDGDSITGEDMLEL